MKTQSTINSKRATSNGDAPYDKASNSSGRAPKTKASSKTVSSSELLGERLRAARVNKGWTQEQAGEEGGLSRLAVLQIEAGSRAVSSLELLRLAQAYERQVEDLLNPNEAETDPMQVLGRISGGASAALRADIKPFLDQLEVAVMLAQCTGENTIALPPLYQFNDPRFYREAIEQGREMAMLERKRLGLGSSAIDDVAAMISCQSIWTTAVSLPDDVSGLFFHHKQYGLAVLINFNHSRARRRFSYSHEYAHALVDRGKPPTPTSRQNASDLVEKRANAFAGEFLMPESGVREILDRMQKGLGSREYSLLYDVASDEVLPHETRNDASSQRITAREIAILAHDFKVSYDVAAYRLSDIGVVKRSHLEELLSPNQKENGRQLIVHLDLFNGDDAASKEPPRLERQLALLAIEARRREKIGDSRFCQICTEIAGYAQKDTDQLLRIARSIA